MKRHLAPLLLLALACSSPTRAGAPPPKALSPLDHAELRAVVAEVRAADATVAAIQSQLCARSPECRQAQEAQAQAATKREDLFGRLRKTYQISEGDQVGTSGEIVRKR